MPTNQEFRDTMAALASSVCVITTNGPAGKGGFTASAVCSVTDSPPTVLVCMNRSSSQRPIFTTNGVLCVNILANNQEEIAKAFSRPAGSSTEDRFKFGTWQNITHDLPALNESLACLATRIVNLVDVGTHQVMFCEVDEILLSNPQPGLVYFNRAYCHPEPIVKEKVSV